MDVDMYTREDNKNDKITCTERISLFHTKFVPHKRSILSTFAVRIEKKPIRSIHAATKKNKIKEITKKYSRYESI